MTPNDKQAKRKKPKPLSPYAGPVYHAGFEMRGKFKDFVYVTMREGYDYGDDYFDAKQCRQLGTWLIKAADYLDSKKVRRER